jgi:hypothetical protein
MRSVYNRVRAKVYFLTPEEGGRTRSVDYGDCVFHNLALPRAAAEGLGFLPLYVPNSVVEEYSPKFAPTWF